MKKNLSMQDLPSAQTRLNKILAEQKRTGHFTCSNIRELLQQNRLYTAAQIAYRQLPQTVKNAKIGDSYRDAMRRWGNHLEHYNDELSSGCTVGSRSIEPADRSTMGQWKHETFYGDPEGLYGLRRKRKPAKRKAKR